MTAMRMFKFLLVSMLLFRSAGAANTDSESGLVGYWKLRGDCRDYSGQEHDGVSEQVDLSVGAFNGHDARVRIDNSSDLQFGAGDFTIAADVFTDQDFNGAFGTILSKFDPYGRRGFQLALCSNTSGYNGQSSMRQFFCGLDNGSTGKWTDCGRPNAKTHISDALTVFNGELYAGTTDAQDEKDWARVFRYSGGQKWTDCGRLGAARTRGVYAMVVHNGELFAATSASHGAQPADMDFGRVYRYLGNQKWEDIGQPGENYRLNSLASYNGQLYVTGFNIGPEPGHVYVYDRKGSWRSCGEFNGWPHALAVHGGQLLTAYPQGEVFAYDGSSWKSLGNPFQSLAECNQIHSIGEYLGELYVGCWPAGKVAVFRDGQWINLGRVSDATEIIGLTTYNGSLYAGTIPRAEVARFEGLDQWRTMRRLFDPPGFGPVPVGSGAKEVQDWSRASSMTIYQGKLFVSTATCYRTLINPPRPDENRGNVYSFETGACVSSDRDWGAGWKHVVAVRRGQELKLYVDGQLADSSISIEPAIDASTDDPLYLGYGPHGYFRGKLNEVRLYNRALAQDSVRTLYAGSIERTARLEPAKR